MAVVNERAIEGSGTSEEEWKRSHVLDRMLDVSFPELLARSMRLVVLSPHPDDEVLGCGGLLNHAALEGVAVAIVAITDGEQCYPGHAAWSPDQLRVARTAELHRAIERLGLDPRCIVRLRMADGSIEGNVDVLSSVLQDLLLPTDLVLSPWEHDGHPDHEAAFAAASRATRAVDCRLVQYPIWAWHWMTPGSPDFLALDTRRLSLAPSIHRAKLEAIACFDTQTGNGRPEIDAPVLPPHVVERLTRSFEVFFL